MQGVYDHAGFDLPVPWDIFAALPGFGGTSHHDDHHKRAPQAKMNLHRGQCSDDVYAYSATTFHGVHVLRVSAHMCSLQVYDDSSGTGI